MVPSSLLRVLCFSALLYSVVECKNPVTCFQCTWDAQNKVTDKEIKAQKEIWDKLKDSKDGIDNPFTVPFFGLESFNPTKEQPVPGRRELQSHCENCTLINGVCTRWAFYTTNAARNVTWMCVNTPERGCWEQDMGDGVIKEVCICDDEDQCNSARTLIISTGALFLTFFFVIYSTVLQRLFI